MPAQTSVQRNPRLWNGPIIALRLSNSSNIETTRQLTASLQIGSSDALYNKRCMAASKIKGAAAIPEQIKF